MEYDYLTKESHFLACDDESEYDRRLLYTFSESNENDYFEGTLFVPLNKDEVKDWTFKHFKKIGTMYILHSRKYILTDTKDWFQIIALPFDDARRIQRLFIQN